MLPSLHNKLMAHTQSYYLEFKSHPFLFANRTTLHLTYAPQTTLKSWLIVPQFHWRVTILIWSVAVNRCFLPLSHDLHMITHYLISHNKVHALIAQLYFLFTINILQLYKAALTVSTCNTNSLLKRREESNIEN